ncbi:twin-arginine translocase TatA/TatE family subunit [Demequina sp. NBRC 110057]|uniref:Sec-independent protein translocase subunit TatA/TatB n=1 Tax=Demequina sp. NBRC 110057 TaxID=1570346 RepID=UPI0009FED23C|nr:twin-arginine translocase TatA/TatE family subunit [Demequina sp. NBRC 110057]
MFDINGGELLVIILVAILVVGPERMPEYAKNLREWVVRGRDYVNTNKDQLKSDVGVDVDWKQYDPRQYDPRRIVRDALAEPTATRPAPPAGATAAATPAAASDAASGVSVTATGIPYDADAT